MQSLKILKKLRNNNGVFVAAGGSHYAEQAWIRDNIYEAIGLEHIDIKDALKTYHALLDVFLKHEYKIEWAIKEKPDARYKYIHARFCPNTYNEFSENWGNKQNDSIGAFLFKIGDLIEKEVDVLRNINDFRIVQKLILYLESVEYWHDKDNGVWEENEEVHSSSVGACVAGLKKCEEYFFVPYDLIEKGQNKLTELLPRESITKDVDLAQLSLIYPFNIVTDKQAKQIITNVEKFLVRNKGVIRYVGDQYFHKDGEAEWCFGFPWLAIIYKQMNNIEKYEFYLNKTREVMNHRGEIPELYFANTEEHNVNCPLGWAQALHIIAEK